MYRVILTAVDVVPAAIVLVPLFTVLHYTVYDRNLRKSLCYSIFCLYMSAVFILVGIPNVTYLRPEVNLNLIPFAGIIADLKNCMLNVVMFLPLGLFLPILWKHFRKCMPCVAYGFGFSLTIELLQMLTFRATDVNDLICNTAGTWLGFLLAKPLIRKYPAIEEANKDLYLLGGLSFCVMFFLHPFLSTWI